MTAVASPILTALYHRQPDEAARLAAAAEQLTIWEAAALGCDEQVRCRAEESPASVNAHAADGHLPLGLAAFFARPSTVRLLLELGADPGGTSQNAMRVQPLHAAVAGRSLEVLRLLLARGVDVDARQQVGYTALMGAASAGREDLVDLLLDTGVDPGLAAEDGKTAATLAREHHHEVLAERLEARVASQPRSEGPAGGYF